MLLLFDEENLLYYIVNKNPATTQKLPFQCQKSYL